MSDRHQELLRQRALVQEHLAWLDREIARDAGAPSSPAPASTPRPAAPAPTGYLASQATAITRHASHASPPAAAASPDTPASAAAADAILSEYRVAPDTLKTDIRKGCLLYFVAALALVALGVTALYFLISKR